MDRANTENASRFLEFLEKQESFEKFRSESLRVLRKILAEHGMTRQWSLVSAFKAFNFKKCRDKIADFPEDIKLRLSEFIDKSEKVVTKIEAGFEKFHECLELFKVVKDLDPNDIEKLIDFLQSFAKFQSDQQEMINTESFKEKPLDEIMKYASDVVRAIQAKKVPKTILKKIPDRNIQQIIQNLIELKPK